MRNELIVGTIAVFVLACGGGTPPERGAAEATAEVPGEALERAREAADSLGGELMSTLMAELNEHGPPGAVRVCSEVAQDIAEAHSAADMTVRRVSLRVRNPADRPDGFEAEVLRRLEARHREGDLPEEVVEVVTDDGARRLRYMRPLTVKKPCLACHGDLEAIDPEVRELLSERYPDDEAVGYEAGDLRGAVSVAVRLP